MRSNELVEHFLKDVFRFGGIQHATADRVGAAEMERLACGARGAQLMALGVMISTFGCANGLILAGARVAWAMARDGLFFSRAGRLNAAHVPGAALWLQCAWAALLALSGRYGDLLDYVIIAELLFYLLTVAGLFALARRTGGRPRGVGYPWLQSAYLVLARSLELSPALRANLVVKEVHGRAREASEPAGSARSQCHKVVTKSATR